MSESECKRKTKTIKPLSKMTLHFRKNIIMNICNPSLGLQISFF